MLAPAPSAPKPETKVPAVPDNGDSKKMEETPAETAEVKKTEESKVVEPSLEVRSLPSYFWPSRQDWPFHTKLAARTRYLDFRSCEVYITVLFWSFISRLRMPLRKISAKPLTQNRGYLNMRKNVCVDLRGIEVVSTTYYSSLYNSNLCYLFSAPRGKRKVEFITDPAKRSS